MICTMSHSQQVAELGFKPRLSLKPVLVTHLPWHKIFDTVLRLTVASACS